MRVRTIIKDDKGNQILEISLTDGQPSVRFYPPALLSFTLGSVEMDLMSGRIQPDLITDMRWFNRVGTISLEYSFMRERIYFGQSFYNEATGMVERDLSHHSSLCISEWTPFIPEVFQPGAIRTLFEIFNEYLSAQAIQSTIEMMLLEFQKRAEQAYQDGKLTNRGWK